jgi:hypothetical protein
VGYSRRPADSPRPDPPISSLPFEHPFLAEKMIITRIESK